MFRSPTPVVKNILLINVGLFAITAIFGLPLNQWFGLYSILSENFGVYQFLTYMWLHGGLGHIFWNMLMIFFLGPLLEQVWGGKRFAIFYLVCGIGAGLLYGTVDYMGKLSLKNDAEIYLSDPSPEAFEQFIIDNKSKMNVAAMSELLDAYSENPRYEQETLNAVRVIYERYINYSSMVGASGALYGLLFAFAYLFPNTEFYIYFLFPVKAKYLAFFAAMISIYSEFNRAEGDNVAHLAHLGGMLIAFILLKFWNNDTKRFY